ncbi:hypothetical protein N0V90_011945 [Kalmusia sp. IMI 367209]|nr:hypothetical protein N0V90_011945 [Kalmusia sp. IMI 367209]
MKAASLFAYPAATVCLILAATAEPRPLTDIIKVFNVPQSPLQLPNPLADMPSDESVSTGVIISDVIGKTQAIAIFSGLTRDIDPVSGRLDDASQNATVLAPDNSVMRGLKRKPWEDPEDYEAFGAEAYKGQDGEDRAHKNLRRFVERHVVPVSPWEEGKKVKTLDGNEVWWETKDGKKRIQPVDVENVKPRKASQNPKVATVAVQVVFSPLFNPNYILRQTSNHLLVPTTITTYDQDNRRIIQQILFRLKMHYESGDLAICFTCGTQFDSPLSSPPKSCPICDDPRQYVPPTGQQWTSLVSESTLQVNEFNTDPHDSRIHYITTKPVQPSSTQMPAGLSDSTTTRKQLGIGERAILLQTDAGNVLWDLVAWIDDATVEFVKEKGGLKAIVREDKHGVRQFITGATEIMPGVTAIQAGGHFDGSMVLHWEKKLFIADTMMSVPSGFYQKDRLPGTTTFSFMWAYPNMIPLPPSAVYGIWKALKPYAFDSTYGGFPGQNVTRPDLKAQVLESAKIFLRMGGHENAAIFNETL